MANNQISGEIRFAAPGVSGVLKGVSDGLAQVGTEASAAAKACGAASFQITKFGGDAEKAGKKLKDVPDTTEQVSSAIEALTKIIKDSPKGFEAVKKGIGPLLSSFRNVSSSAGGVGNAFKAIGGSIIGPAGVAIALAVFTAG